MEDPTTEVPSAPDRATEERAGKLVGEVIAQRYRIDTLLAVGGMGAVYRGYHLALQKRVAIKLLLPGTDNLPELVARFEREAIAGAHVNHPHVAAATDFGQIEDGTYFLVLEYVSGKTLRQVGKRGPLPVARAVRIARQVAEALGAVHAMGIVHRDVKPQNVMLLEGDEDFAKLIDFGLAKVSVEKVVAQQSSVRPPAPSLPEGMVARRVRLDSLVDSKPRLTGVDVIMGTVAYLAPEAALGMDSVDARSDLYALGLVLYQMLAGVHPFDATNDAALFAQQRFTPPPSFAERVPGIRVPPPLEAVVMRLLAKDPAERFSTAAALVEALDAAMASSALPPAPPVPSSGRSYLPVVVGAVAVASGVAAALLFNASSVGPQPTRPPPAVVSARPTVPAASVLPPPVVTAPPTPPTVSASTASAAPSASAPPAPPISDAGPPGPDPYGERALLQRTLRVHDYAGGELVFLDLVAHEAAAFHEPDTAVAARELAVALDRGGKADRVFDALLGRLGSDGLDILYDLVATKGKASAALRAATLLRRKAVLDRATPEMRIAFLLREAPCVDKLPLLDRAAKDGDARALVVLSTQGIGCFKKNNHAVQEAMAAIRSRLSRGL